MNETPFIYRAKEFAGVRPLFVLPSAGNVPYFEGHGGAPEAKLIEWAERLMPKEGYFLDIGAHVGTWGITFALKGHAVQCFEAQPWLASLCSAGFALNGLRRGCAPFGFSDKSGTFELTSPYADGGCGSVVCKFEGDLPIRIQVELRTLDAEYDLTPDVKVSLMKIDVEGSELDVLRGGKRTIQMWRPAIIFEAWEEEKGQRKEELFRFIKDKMKYKAIKTSWPDTWLAEYEG